MRLFSVLLWFYSEPDNDGSDAAGKAAQSAVLKAKERKKRMEGERKRGAGRCPAADAWLCSSV